LETSAPTTARTPTLRRGPDLRPARAVPGGAEGIRTPDLL